MRRWFSTICRKPGLTTTTIDLDLYLYGKWPWPQKFDYGGSRHISGRTTITKPTEV